MARLPLRLVIASTAIGAIGLAIPPGAAAQEPVYTPVTDERLRAPADGDWLMYRRTYDSWGYSPLDQITTGNAANLEPVWSLSTGVTSGHESPAVVNDGIMFVTTPEDRVIAVDARSGNQLWLYQRQFPEDMSHPHRTNRGVGLFGDKVYYTTHDAFVVALDAMTGDLAWEAEVADYRTGVLHDHGAARRQRQDPRRRVGRRAGHPGFRGRLRRRIGRGGVGGRTRSRVPASPATRPGRARRGAPAARPSGSPARSTPSSTSPTGGRATRVPGSETSGPATTSTPTRSSPSTPTPAS